MLLWESQAIFILIFRAGECVEELISRGLVVRIRSETF